MGPNRQGVCVWGGCFRVYPCNCMTQAVCHPPTRIQCPAIVAFVVTFLGAILSFTCIPVTTKDASVQSAHQGKPPLPTWPMDIPLRPRSQYPVPLLGMGRPSSQGVRGDREEIKSPTYFLLLIPCKSSWAQLWELGKPRPLSREALPGKFIKVREHSMDTGGVRVSEVPSVQSHVVLLA